MLRGHGVGPGVKVVWCGQNSLGIVTLVVAARKLGVTAVPLNYRLSDEEAAYVTDHCDAAVVYVDAEYAADVRARPRRHPEGRATSSCSTARRPTGMTGVDELMARRATEPPEPADADARPARR